MSFQEVARLQEENKKLQKVQNKVDDEIHQLTENLFEVSCFPRDQHNNLDVPCVYVSTLWYLLTCQHKVLILFIMCVFNGRRYK